MKTNLLNTFATIILLILFFPSFAQEKDGVEIIPTHLIIFDETPPEIQWISPSDTVNYRNYSLILELSHSYYPVSKVQTRLNEQNWKEHKKPFSHKKDQEAKEEIDKRLGGKGRPYYKDEAIDKHQVLPFSLKEGNNKIKISVTNQGQITKDTIFNIYYAPTIIRLPTLHLVNIAVGDYEHEDIKDLRYPVKDAKAIDSMFTINQLGLFHEIKRYTYLNKEANWEAIKTLLNEKLVHPHVQKDDVILFFFSAHGDLTKEDKFLFMPYDFDPKNPNTGFFWYEIISPISSLDCKSLLIFDTCHSGKLKQNNLSKDLLQKMALIMASSDIAYEDQKLKHGVLTKAILEVLSNKVDMSLVDKNGLTTNSEKTNKLNLSTQEKINEITRDNIITPKELGSYVAHRVPELLKMIGEKYKQYPLFEGKGKFDIYEVNESRL